LGWGDSELTIALLIALQYVYLYHNSINLILSVRFSLTGITILALLLACEPLPNPGGSGDPGNVNNGSCTSTTALTVKNKSYGTQSRQKVDMFLPANRTCNTPTVLLVTGGIWAFSSRTCDLNDFVIRLKKHFQQRGYAVITMDYRYATGNPADQIQDFQQCVDSVTTWAGRYVFSDRIHLVGESSGAYLAMIYALQYQNPKTASVVAISPIMDFADTTLMRINSGVDVNVVGRATCEKWMNVVNSSNTTLLDLLCDYMGSPRVPNHDASILGIPCYNPLQIVSNYPLNCSYASLYPNHRIPPIKLIHGSNDNLVPTRQSVVVDSIFGANPAFTMSHDLTFLSYSHGYLSATNFIKNKIDSTTFEWVSSF
jgi:acetyl esterase/lipase